MTATTSKTREHFGRRSVRVPTVLQMEAAECGAAALTMVLNYFGRMVSLDEVRNACAVSRDGVNVLKISQAAEQFGLVVRRRKCGVDALDDLDLPMIVFWNQNHFLVVERFGRSRVRLNDPASGRRWVSDDEFARGFTKFVLTFEPGPDFAPDRLVQRPHPLVEMLRLLGHSRTGLVYALISGIAVVVPVTAAAMVAALFVEQVLIAQNTVWVALVIGTAALIAALQIALYVLQQKVLVRLQTKLAIRMSARFIWHLVRLPTSFFLARSPGGLVSRTQLNNAVARVLSGQLATVAISMLTMILYPLMLFAIDARLAAIAVGIAVLNAVAFASVARARIATNQQLEQFKLRLDGYTFMTVGMIDDLKATGAEDELFGRWTGTQAQLVGAEQRYGLLTQGLLTVPGFLILINTVVILGVGGLFVLRGELSLGGLVAFQLLTAQFLAPVSAFVAASATFQNARAWTQQVEDVMRQPLDRLVAETDNTALRRSVGGRLDGLVELRNVTFGYVTSEPPLIKDLSLTVRPGERVALVGVTGSGKSTVANIVAGLYEPWSGEVLFDGRPRREVAKTIMHASLAKVDQSIMLFAGTITENIRLWDDSIPLEDVMRAATDACIADEISAKPGGFSHMLTDDGRNLSGGQRQRIEIARALATNPSIMILDEATSALDVVTEEQLDTNLRRRGCTALIVAHRLSTIRDCDQILVLADGEVVERGTHDELIALECAYAELVGNE